MNNVNWRTTDSILTVNYGYDENDNPMPVPSNILNKKLPIKKGDRVALAYHDSQPAITFPVTGKTLKDLFKSIETGMKTKIKITNGNTIVVRKIIDTFIHEKDKKRLVNLYEFGNLTPYDLVRDGHDFYEGNLTQKNHIWIYAVGS